MTISRLFIVPQERVVEYPLEWPRYADNLKQEDLDQWECYAYNFQNDGVIGPFDPILERDNVGVFIKPPNSRYPFYHDDGESDGDWGLKRQCWQQSGHTLRFIKKRKQSGEEIK